MPRYTRARASFRVCPGAPSPTLSDTYLHELSALAGHSFASTSEAIDAILQTIVGQLGLRTSFLSRISTANNRFEIRAVYNTPGGCDFTVHSVHALTDTYCCVTAGSNEPVPFMAENVATHPLL